MRRTPRIIVKQTEEWLDERWRILWMDNPPRQADLSYYEGAIKAVEFLGYSWKRDKDGKHIITKDWCNVKTNNLKEEVLAAIEQLSSEIESEVW